MKKRNPDNVWSVADENFEVKSILGTGSYGTVRKAICKLTKQPVAIKFVEGVFQNEYACVKLLREI